MGFAECPRTEQKQIDSACAQSWYQEYVGGSVWLSTVLEQWNARKSLGLGSRSPVQGADVESWGGFPLTAQKGGGKPQVLRSPELRDVRKQPTHSFAHTENSSLCWVLAVADIGLDCACSLSRKSSLVVVGRAAYLIGPWKLP